MSSQYLKISDLTVDLNAQRVMRAGATLDVRGLTYDLLAALIARRGERATLQNLVDDVWGGEAVTNEVITQRVRLLRRALHDDPAQPRYIETVRQKGYRLCASVEEMPAPAPDSSPPPQRPVWRVAAVVGMAVLAALLIWRQTQVADSDPLVERARAYAGTGQGDDNLRAIDLYEQKLASSPGHYGASLGLSFAYSQRVCRHERNPEFVSRARGLAEALVVANPNDAEAISARAYAEDCAGNLEAALAGYLRAYELDRTQLDALASAAHLQQVKGDLALALGNNLFVEQQANGRPFRYVDIQIARCLELMTFDEAAGARYARTVKLYPDNLFAAVSNVRFLMSRGRLEEARTAAARSVRLGAASADLRVLQSELAILQDRSEEVQAMLHQATSETQTNAWPSSALEFLLPGSVPATKLRERAKRFRAEMAAGDVWPDAALHLATLLASLGDEQAAAQELGEAIRLGYRDVAYLEMSPMFAGLRRLPGYDAELRRMREAASAERDRALAAPWWSPALIDPDAL